MRVNRKPDRITFSTNIVCGVLSSGVKAALSLFLDNLWQDYSVPLNT